MAPRTPSSARFRIELLDVCSMVIGYGLAAVLFRAFWPRRRSPPRSHSLRSGSTSGLAWR